MLISGTADDPELQARVEVFRQTLEEFGWLEGCNIQIDVRFAAMTDQYSALAREMVALHPEVILGHTTPVTAALHWESRTVPIVFINVSDPVGSGFVASLARPGGNITGLMLYEEGITGKWLALLKEIAPHLKRAALVANPISTPYDYFVRSAKAVAPLLALELVPSPIANATDIERVIEMFGRVPNGGVLVLPDGTSSQHRDLIIALAASHRLPTVYAHRFFVSAGGLMSYGRSAGEPKSRTMNSGIKKLAALKRSRNSAGDSSHNATRSLSASATTCQSAWARGHFEALI